MSEPSDWDLDEEHYRSNGWKGPPLWELATRFEKLGVYEMAQDRYVLELRCGRCDRILDSIGNRWVEFGDPVAKPHYDGADMLVNRGRLISTRPAIKRELAGVEPSLGDEEVEPSPSLGDELRWQWQWHKRCGATYVLRLERLTLAYLDALEHGRRRITAGVDF